MKSIRSISGSRVASGHRREASEAGIYAKYTFKTGNVYTKASLEPHDNVFKHEAIHRQGEHKDDLWL